MTKTNSSTSSSNPGAAPRAFRRLADAFLAESHARFPEEASALGLSKFDAGLSVNDVATHEAQNALVARTLAAIEALPEAEFTGDDYLDRRGFLKPGMFADVVVFDPATIGDRATYEKPQQYAVGVRQVFVNGVHVLKDGEPTGSPAGRALKGPGAVKAGS